ncbi:restriction endonuclease subunit S [Brevundimonas sp.]|uniref:restriction endonuclease subunit S n=1 Tax=Brevundimonas sp. TaxID=1871086 RepID=UPI002D50D5F0|nr:restriction endonuclease subunit S [Brevundimonas sp.]HYD26486.1 restriction endonuclease subunit S [Brevundimonas sp.]
MSLEDQKVVLAMGGIDAFKHVDIDDFVISLRSFQGGIERCQYGGCVSPAYTALKPAQQIAAGYWEYLLKSKPYIAALQAITDGIREGKTIRYEQFGWLPLPVPPVSEQGAIATFLDREIGKIDALVEAQRQLIELLKEKRQAVISHAVTKGLGPTAPTKDSGIEWLGEVPAHWEVKALKHVGEFNAGAGFPDAEQGLQSEELPFHKVNALALADPDDFLTTGGNTVSRETAKRLGAYVFPAGSIVFAKIGAALLLGRLRRLRRPACLDNNMMGLSVRDGNDLEFIRSAMSLVKFDLISNPGTVPSLNKGQIANAVIAIPPLAEQEAISAHIQQTALRYRELTTEAEAAISLLQERRAALISAAVTGKIDVRCMAPEQAEAA